MRDILKLLALVGSEKINISHLPMGQGAKISNRLHKREMKTLNHGLQNSKHFENRLNRYREIATRTGPKMNTFMRFDADRK